MAIRRLCIGQCHERSLSLHIFQFFEYKLNEFDVSHTTMYRTDEVLSGVQFGPFANLSRTTNEIGIVHFIKLIKAR